MRKHTLEATGGRTYSQLGKDDELRTMWVNETAVTTALNTAYFAESVATFAIVMGVALLLAGIGFGVLTLSQSAAAGVRYGESRIAAPSSPGLLPLP